MRIGSGKGLRSLAVSVIAGACLVLSQAPAGAALVAADWLAAGDGKLTQDTLTGLQWLDLTLSNNHSYNDIRTNYLGAGQQFEGFRYATGAEVYGLFVNAGIGATWETPAGGGFYTNANAFQELVGITADDYYGRDWSTGMFAQEPGGMMPLTGVEVSDSSRLAWVESFEGFVGGGSWAWGPDLADGVAGSWLVRTTPQAVPEPSTLLLLGSGMLGLAAARRRR